MTDRIKVMNPALRTITLCVSAFIVAGALCIIALVASGLIPSYFITESISRDSAWIEQRGDYPVFFSETPKYRYDGFTDGIMLMQAIPDDNLSAVENAVMAPYHAIGDGTPGGDGTGGISPTQALLSLVADPDIEQQRDYVLYWHGYVVPLRILLTFMTPSTIIALQCVVFAVLSLLTFEVFRRTGGWSFALAFLVSLVATFAWITPLGFTHFTVFHLALIATLALWWILQSAKRHEWVVPLFLVVGLFTAFFDLLTIPLLTFLLPLSLYLLWLIKVRKESSLLKAIYAGVAWLAGYAGFWASKWAMTAIVYSAEYANSEFAYALAMRSGTAGEGLGFRFAAIYNNLYQLFAAHPDGSLLMGEFFAIVAAVTVALVAIWWLMVKMSRTSFEQVKLALPMLLVALGPYVWYFVVAQHSTFHSWFTWRLQTASIVAAIFFVLLSIDWSNLLCKKPVKTREK